MYRGTNYPFYSTGFWTITFANDARIIEKAVELHNTLVAGLVDTTSEWSMVSMIQPFPTLFSKHSVRKDGNVLGLDRATENLIRKLKYRLGNFHIAREQRKALIVQVQSVFLVDIAWDQPEEDAIFRATGEKMIKQLAAYAKTIDGLSEFIYIDYADSTQNPLASYGAENLQKLKSASEKYDPKGIFQMAVPGAFKLANVEEQGKIANEIP